MYFLRAIEVELKSGKKVLVTEFSYLQSLKFTYLCDVEDNPIAQTQFLCPELTTEELLTLDTEELALILVAKDTVNAPVELQPLEESENSYSVTLDECLESLCDRWKKDPVELAEKFSLNQILWWSNLISAKDQKVDKVLHKDEENSPNKETKKSKNTESEFQSLISKYKNSDTHKNLINTPVDKYRTAPHSN